MPGQAVTGKILKALFALIISLLGSLSTVLTGNTTFEQITDGQWTTVGLFALTAFGAVFGLAGWSGPVTNGRP